MINRIDRIVFEFGGQNAMARALKCSQATVWSWTKTGRVPSDRIPQIIAAARLLDPPLKLEPNDFFEIQQ
jgi:hypothetical protein